MERWYILSVRPSLTLNSIKQTAQEHPNWAFYQHINTFQDGQHSLRRYVRHLRFPHLSGVVRPLQTWTSRLLGMVLPVYLLHFTNYKWWHGCKGVLRFRSQYHFQRGTFASHPRGIRNPA